MKLFIVGVHRQPDDPHGWILRGVFTSEDEAVKYCTDYLHFVGPVEIDVDLGSTAQEWPGAYYPLAGEESAG